MQHPMTSPVSDGLQKYVNHGLRSSRLRMDFFHHTVKKICHIRLFFYQKRLLCFVGPLNEDSTLMKEI